MSQPEKLGFSPYVEASYGNRGEALAAKLDLATQAALAELETFRLEVYWEDQRVYCRKAAAAMLGVEEDSAEAIELATAMSSLALRMADKFAVPMAEILVFGSVQGELPALETKRIINI